MAFANFSMHIFLKEKNRFFFLLSVEDTEKNLWPCWLRVVAWLLVVLAILPSAFFVILYSMEWGTEKSNQWLTAFFLTFIEEAAVIDPLKVSPEIPSPHQISITCPVLKIRLHVFQK